MGIYFPAIAGNVPAIARNTTRPPNAFITVCIQLILPKTWHCHPLYCKVYIQQIPARLPQYLHKYVDQMNMRAYA